MANRVKSIRTKLGWSQYELAERVGTSQQQIQRIESGKIVAKLETAFKISEALGRPLNAVFPGSAGILRKIAAKQVRSPKYAPNPTELESLRTKGIDLEIRHWSVLLQLRGHKNPMWFEISTTDHNRFIDALQKGSSHTDTVQFFVFDTETDYIGVNLSEIVYCKLLIDIGEFIRKDSPNHWVMVFFSGNEIPVTFEAESDPHPPEDDEQSEFQDILSMLECEPSPNERFQFLDDGDLVFLTAGDIALIQIPRRFIDYEASDAISGLDTDSGDAP